ncbi:MAG TPA: glycosyltransferase [Vicinamibacterales bacterium]|jgi:anaerobic magnesium-protoporphyrin IX monomethyl ester cyclase|nr:glycosyltransferase [Vicinamibacterales bacterium]
MRIAFDGSTLRPGRTGVGYYTEHLLHHLVAETRDDELIVVSNRPIDTTRPLPSHVRVITPSWHLPRMVWLQAMAPRVLERLGPDVGHFTNGMVPLGSTVPTVVTIHDISLTLYPRYHPLRRVLLNRPLVNLATRRADAIITVSETAKREIVRLYGLEPSRVHVVHEAAAPSFKPIADSAQIERVRRQYRLPDRFVLYVGTIEPRKNLPTLFDAFARRWKSGDLPHQLVCVGPYGWLSRDLEQRLERLQVARAVSFTGYVPFDDLPVLYSLAEMFVYPSVYEGFGLPVVEAMACGTPVITGPVAALTEVGGDALERVEQLDAELLGDAMVALARNREHRERLRRLGLERAEQFSWQRAARETLAVYREVARQPAAATEPAAPAAVQIETATEVLFGQAYFLRFDPKLWAAQQPYAPLGAMYAAACVRERGYRVAFFDAMLAESEANWAEALDRCRPRLAVLYEDSFNYLSKMCLLRMRQAALAMIDAACAREITVVVAGSDATDHPGLYLERGAHLVVIGEGEQTLVEVMDALMGRIPNDLSTVPGVCFRGADGRLVTTPSRPVIRDLDALPRAAWDLVDIDRYRRVWQHRHGYFSMNVVTTRGCPYHCNWCAKPIYGQRYTARSPENVVDEIAWLARTYRPDHIWIADDIFGLKPGWIERFAQLTVERGVKVPFKCLLRADGVTDAIARSLQLAGCRTAWIGAESGSQRILDAMEKGTRVDQIVMATRRLHAVGIEVGFFLQFGYPGEAGEDIERTLRMVRDCRPDDIGVSVSYPLPGTPFYERVKAQLGEKRNWVDSDDLAMMYPAAYGPEFYRVLHALAHAEFRMRRSFDTLVRAMRRPWNIQRRLAREIAGGAYHASRVPILRRRAGRLARQTAQPSVSVLPILSPQAAAVPSEQPR